MRLKELSPPAHHRRLLKCGRLAPLSRRRERDEGAAGMTEQRNRVRAPLGTAASLTRASYAPEEIQDVTCESGGVFLGFFWVPRFANNANAHVLLCHRKREPTGAGPCLPQEPASHPGPARREALPPVPPGVPAPRRHRPLPQFQRSKSAAPRHERPASVRLPLAPPPPQQAIRRRRFMRRNSKR